MINGKAFSSEYDRKSCPAWKKIRKISDNILIENGLSIIDEPEKTSISHYEWSMDKQGTSWKSQLKKTIDETIRNVDSFEDFIFALKEQNITVKYEAKCGGCAPEYMTYLLKVDKNITKAKIDINYKAINDPGCDPYVTYKPLIQLYPKEDTKVTVKLGHPNLLTTTYPKYKNGWNITAKPNGEIIDNNGKTYYGLYWEGLNNINDNFKDGFVVNKEETINFLEEKLAILGLTEREANEFIIYWLPKLEANEYNLIRFESIENINKQMPLDITPTPDTIIRVLMKYKPLKKKINIKKQTLKPQERKGFTVVVWGGPIINS